MHPFSDSIVSRTLRHPNFAAAILFAVAITLLYSQIVFFGRSLIPSLYQPYGVMQSGSYDPSEDGSKVPLNRVSFNFEKSPYDTDSQTFILPFSKGIRDDIPNLRAPGPWEIVCIAPTSDVEKADGDTIWIELISKTGISEQRDNFPADKHLIRNGGKIVYKIVHGFETKRSGLHYLKIWLTHQGHSVMAFPPRAVFVRLQFPLGVDLPTPAFFEEPVNALVGNLYKRRKLPLWNPYQGCGVPLAAQYSTRAFFPYQIVENLCPTATWDIFLLGRLFIAGFVTFLFLQHLGLSFASAFLGGLLYMFSGSLTWFINLEQLANTAMMVPVLFYALSRLAQRGTKFDIAISSIAIALLLLAGQPETAIYVMFLGLLFYGLSFLTGGGFVREAGKSLVNSVLGLARRVTAGWMRFGLAVLLGLGLAAPLVIPFIELEFFGFHLHPPQSRMGTSGQFSTQFLNLILFPLYDVKPIAFSSVTYNSSWDYLGGYCGVTCVLLALFSLFKKTPVRKFAVLFVVYAVFLLLKNCGILPFLWLGHLPLFSQSWSQRWAGPTWTFSFAAAAAIGFETLLSILPRDAASPHFTRPVHLTRVRWVRSAVVLIIIGLIAVLYFLYRIDHVLSSPICLSYRHASIYVGSVVLSAFLAVLYLARSRAWVAAAIVLLAVLELNFCIPRGLGEGPQLVIAFGITLIGIAGAIFVSAGMRRVASVILLACLALFLIHEHSVESFPKKRPPLAEPPYVKVLRGQEIKDFRIYGLDGVLFPNYAGAFTIPDIRFVNSLSVRPYQEFVESLLLLNPRFHFYRLWFTGLLDHQEPDFRNLERDYIERRAFYNLASVRYILLPSGERIGDAGSPGETIRTLCTSLYDREINIYEDRLALPRARLVRNWEVVKTRENALSRMAQPDWDSRVSALLSPAELPNLSPLLAFLIKNSPFPEKLPTMPSETKGNYGEGLDRAEILLDDVDHLVIHTKANARRLLVLSDSYYPGWEAFVDGYKTPIFIANAAFRGVALEPGEHRVEFSYKPRSFRTGVLIALVCALVLIVPIRIRRAKKAITPQV